MRGHHPIASTQHDSYPRAALSGLILAGGAGRRVGGRDKGLLHWQGAPLVAHVVRRIAPQVGTLLISCNRNAAQYLTYAETVVPDSRPDYCGPLAGLEAASVKIRSEYVLVTPCDTPMVPQDLAARLFASLQAAGRGIDVCYAHDGRRAHYLCALLRSSSLASIGSFLDGGERAVHRWMDLHGTVAVDFSDAADEFNNLNRIS